MTGDVPRRSILRAVGVAAGIGLLNAEAALADSGGDADVAVSTARATDASSSDVTLDGSHDDRSGTGPAIDSYTVSEAGSPDPNVEITADWAVSDADENLDQVLVRVYGSSGSLVDSARTDVSDSRASGTDTWKLGHREAETFEVQVTVTDAAGSSTLQTWTVSS